MSSDPTSDTAAKASTTLQKKKADLKQSEDKNSNVLAASANSDLVTAKTSAASAIDLLATAALAIQTVIKDAKPSSSPGASPGSNIFTTTGISDPQAKSIQAIQSQYLDLQNLILLQIACAKAPDTKALNEFRAWYKTHANKLFTV